MADEPQDVTDITYALGELPSRVSFTTTKQCFDVGHELPFTFNGIAVVMRIYYVLHHMDNNHSITVSAYRIDPPLPEPPLIADWLAHP